MDRRAFVGASIAASLAGRRSELPGPTAAAASEAQLPAFELEEATVASLSEGMAAGRWTARSITDLYLDRIQAIDRSGPAINSVIVVNPEAREIAERLDAERRDRGPRGPLHGIPVLVKDNLDTGDRMPTTAGSLALANSRAPADATVVARLRNAGAVLLGKTNLSEWANYRSTRSTSGWSAVGGQTHNPHATDRNSCGSSSGSAFGASRTHEMQKPAICEPMPKAALLENEAAPKKTPSRRRPQASASSSVTSAIIERPVTMVAARLNCAITPVVRIQSGR